MQKTKLIYDWSKVPLVIDVPYACVILGVTYDTLLRRIKKGELKSFRVGKAVRITKSELRRYMGEPEEVAEQEKEVR